jgi:ubiquinone/menaquinone biosynthesis C-methylase UbiE
MISRLLAIPGIFQWQQKTFNNYNNIKMEFSDYLKTGPLNILDIGCSTGFCGQAVFDMNRDSYIGIDITPEYIEYARRTYRKGKYMVMDGRKLEFENNTFDIVIFAGVVHHMDNEIISDCLAQVRRVLKPEGHVFLAEPILTPNELISNIFLSIDRGKYIRESSQYLDLLSGFKIIRKRYFHFSLHRFLSVVAEPNMEDIK